MIELEDVKRLQLGPDDVLVLRPKNPLSDDAAQRIHSQLSEVFPDNKIVVLKDFDAEFEVVSS